MGPQQRLHRQRARPHPRRHPGRLRQGPRLSSVGALAADLSRAHPWLTFASEGPGPWRPLTLDPVPWQQALVAQNARWYPGGHAPQVAAAFVLQYLLQVPAHTLAYAAGLGWWVDPGQLTFTVGPQHVPDRVRLGAVRALAAAPPGPGRGAADPLEVAEAAYRGVAEPLAAAYPSICKLGSATRAGLVRDMWHQAVARGRVVERWSCCFLYALPGCTECAGCPRMADTRHG